MSKWVRKKFGWRIFPRHVQNDLKTLGNRFLGRDARFLKNVMGAEEIWLRFWVILGCQVQNDLKWLGNRFWGRDLNFLEKCQNGSGKKIGYASGTFWNVKCRMTWKRWGTDFKVKIGNFWKNVRDGNRHRNRNQNPESETELDSNRMPTLQTESKRCEPYPSYRWISIHMPRTHVYVIW